ncbi:class I SAM-dependent methyltransferase [Streptomyces boncukensis]|uniref:Class I SAM-dependent methyltransferase n=1 Tax=Streptomyces boncukensis TaxID=2711219 RepID=A0A6G4WPS8_9ACTN|nr:class I SAM-dependent methyltransferase [Streptomyces boncukensis]NGO67266.1 class I SAM-dependent methyltransferase [Streptomyces boncukensis]
MPDEPAEPEQPAADPAAIMAAVDFDAFYQGKPPVKGLEMDLGAPPWVIGEPQPALVGLESTGAFRGEVLDAGCGTGDNALFLAARGHRVTGVDASPTALKQARISARDRKADVAFVESDATRLDELASGRFGSVLDMGLYHGLTDEQRDAYARALHRVTRPGAGLHLFATAAVPGPGIPVPPPLRRESFRERLGAHWQIRLIRLTRCTTAMTRESMLGARDLIAALGGPDPDDMEYDGRGRATAPFWYVHAARL